MEHMLRQLPVGSQARGQKCHSFQDVLVLGLPPTPGGEEASAVGRDNAAVGEVYDDADFYLSLLKACHGYWLPAIAYLPRRLLSDYRLLAAG